MIISSRSFPFFPPFPLFLPFPFPWFSYQPVFLLGQVLSQKVWKEQIFYQKDPLKIARDRLKAEKDRLKKLEDSVEAQIRQAVDSAMRTAG